MTVHTNPITKTYTIGQLVSILNLSRNRIITLLNNDHIFIEYGEIVISTLRGKNVYSVVKTEKITRENKTEIITEEYDNSCVIESVKGKITVTINDEIVKNCVNAKQIANIITQYNIATRNIDFVNVSNNRIEAIYTILDFMAN